jgi:hypothetical protein
VDEPVRVAFVKFGGLAAGGTERWLQMMAANLSRDRFAVDYFYCDAAPYIGAEFKHSDTDPARLEYMRRAGVNLVKFHVGAKDVRTSTHKWLDTDFWELFDTGAYDLVQTATAGPAEYPYAEIDLPVFEYITLNAGINRSRNVALTIHVSQWQRRRWVARGGQLGRSDVIPIPAERPASELDLRQQLGIPTDARVAGFHQRAQDEIFSPIPLDAFRELVDDDQWFVIMGGSDLYREQAALLGLQTVCFLEHDGSAEGISRFLNTLDVFAHGRADGETFGTVFAEAMMHGKACLSHYSPIANGQVETIGPAGLFALDTGDYAAKLERLLTDRDLCEGLARKARPHAERYYSLDSCVRQLERAFETALGRADSASAISAMPYGQSDLGFLVAGPVDDPASVSHHVVVGGIPQASAAGLLPHLLRDGAVYHEAGSANTVLALTAAAAGCTSHLHAPQDAAASGVLADICLNNWEHRLFLEVAPTPADVCLAGLRSAHVVAINAPEWAGAIVPRLQLDDFADRPVLLLKLADGVTVTAQLAALGYNCRAIDREGWFVCLHPAHHQQLSGAVAAWARERRRARRQRMLGAPGRSLLPVRARVGARIDRLGFAWRARRG